MIFSNPVTPGYAGKLLDIAVGELLQAGCPSCRTMNSIKALWIALADSF